jgi:NAD(P) transhydrogenase subunit beta
VPLTAVNFTYLVASALFILGLRGLTHPRTAVRGNLLGATAMLLAVVATLLDRRIVGFTTIAAGLVLGAAIGAALARRIQMTAMPQLVALLNGFGGAASVLVAGAARLESGLTADMPGVEVVLATAASGVIGAVTLSGSAIAFGKLQGLIDEGSIRLPGQNAFNVLIAVAVAGLVVWALVAPDAQGFYPAIVVVSLVLGVSLVLPIGGADMPVVIALLNSYSGLAAAATGFVLGNNVLIIAGSLVGASGMILTRIMCRAMNRSLANVVFGAIEVGAGAKDEADLYAGRVKSTAPEEVAMLFEGARRVVFVPGYGMAASQAQHAVRDLAQELGRRGVEVAFAIHPVAGRMPGHMNVLLAEAGIGYEQLVEMDEVNPTFEQTDVAVVIGANDVVNSLARTDPTCPIAGMPILDADKARAVVVIKRSLSPGFAGIANPLFAADNALMLFGDGKQAVLAILAAMKESA